MPLTIRNQHFGVRQATLTGNVFHNSWRAFDATVPAGLSYDLEIQCAPQTICWDGREIIWQPNFQFDRFPLDAKTWFDIEDSRVETIEGAAHLDGHYTANATHITFGKREGSDFALDIAGRCQGMPFTLASHVALVGYRAVGTFRDTDVSLTALLARTIKLDGMLPQATTLDDSIPRKKMRSKIFLPAEDR